MKWHHLAGQSCHVPTVWANLVFWKQRPVAELGVRGCSSTRGPLGVWPWSTFWSTSALSCAHCWAGLGLGWAEPGWLMVLWFRGWAKKNDFAPFPHLIYNPLLPSALQTSNYSQHVDISHNANRNNMSTRRWLWWETTGNNESTCPYRYIRSNLRTCQDSSGSRPAGEASEFLSPLARCSWLKLRGALPRELPSVCFFMSRLWTVVSIHQVS